jgi:serine/threonine-protein kinase
MPDAGDTVSGAWREALDCVADLLSKPQTERDELLAALAASNPSLHGRVESLLNADREASRVGFLETARFTAANTSTSALREGATLGPYRMVRELGRGGMGEVWLARRDDGLYQGEVAVKTLHPYFAGGALRDRFLREASLLGRLTHPNIARLLDAGVSDGVVYLVLEYVRGEPIDRWCDARKLDVDARLKLFRDLCSAVAHAHANLIVHRDIKPSNILVTDEGLVKLLDFGIGKLLETEPRQEQGELTRITGRIFTPEYAAPEQILGQAVTTATDIHSLGVLLYTLLCGKGPFAAASNEVDLQRAVLHDDPPPMSRAIATLEDDKPAEARATTRPRLQRKLTGDLDLIAMRAMRKAPTDRYPSVLAFADDVERHLRHQPVDARVGSNAYRFGRFVRRHRVGVIAASVVVVALFAGVAGVLWQAQIARTEARKATAVKDFLLDIFKANSELHPDGIRARQTTAEELLDLASRKTLENAEQEPDVRMELLGSIGNLNVLQEKWEQAEKLLRERIRVASERFGPNDARLAEPLLDVAEFLRASGRSKEGLVEARRALTVLRLAGDRSSALRGRAEFGVAQLMLDLGSGKGSEVSDQYRIALAVLERLPPSDYLARAQLGLGRSFVFEEKYAAAVVELQKGIEIATAVRGKPDALSVTGYANLARSLTRLDRLEEAQQYFEKAIEISTYTQGYDHNLTLGPRIEFALYLKELGRLREMTAELQKVLDVSRKRNAPNHVATVRVHSSLSGAFLTLGDFDAADAHASEAINVLEKTPTHVTLPEFLRVRARVALERQKLPQALDFVERAWQGILLVRGPRNYRAATILMTRGEVLTALGRFEDARAALDESIALFKEFELDPDHPDIMSARLAIASAELAQKRNASAESIATAIVAEVSGLPQRERYWTVEAAAKAQLAESRIAAGNPRASCDPLAASIRLRETNSSSSDSRLNRARELRKKYCTA